MGQTWWCVDCRSGVELDKHGRCATCGSEAVESMQRLVSRGRAIYSSHNVQEKLVYAVPAAASAA